MFIERLPVGRTVSRVTIGDMRRDPSCDTEALANVNIWDYGQEGNAGYPSVPDRVARSMEPRPLPDLTGKVTWRLPVTTLRAGHAYAVNIEYGFACDRAVYRTFAHNEPTVNSGSARCQERVPDGMWRRMWHERGQDDRVPDCSQTTWWGPDMPTGWLVARRPGTAWSLAGAQHQFGDPASNACRAGELARGAKELLWRDFGDGGGTFTCHWPQYAPLGQRVPDGWYYSWGWTSARNGAPRDMYLKLEYNADDDIRVIPDCFGFVYASCEAGLRQAGFNSIRRIDLTGSDIDTARGPDIVKRTEPAGGTSAPISREIFVYANPPERQYWASFLQPILRFDRSERWRPLKVDTFVAERTLEGAVAHRICFNGLNACDPLMAVADFQRSSQPDDFVLLNPPLGDDEDDYVTPYTCREPGLQECEKGGVAATYFHRMRSPGGYDVYDYWWFYRFNDVPDAWHATSRDVFGVPLMHEGDWEGVSVGVLPGERSFDYVSFSQHGTWFGYLRDAMQCDGGGLASCSGGPFNQDPDGRRVHAFVADGTHANYPDACRRLAEVNCTSNVQGALETGHDGEKRWGGNDDPGTPLIEFHEDEPWLRWAGRWGITREVRSDWASGPNSPAGPGSNGHHYDHPWEMTCAPGQDGCDGPERDGAATTSAANRASCERWFGTDVPALACSPTQLGDALAAAELGKRGAVQMAVSGPGPTIRTASAPGLAQMVGRPLLPGDRIEVSGRMPSDMRLLLRVGDSRRVLEVRFDRTARSQAERTIAIAPGQDRSVVRLLGRGALSVREHDLRPAPLLGPLAAPPIG